VKEQGVIVADSLLEVFSKHEGFSFPVGRVKNLFLYPVNFYGISWRCWKVL